jgi:hypothetical protein
MPQGLTVAKAHAFDDFAKSPISALRTIFEESHVRLSTLNSSKIARALILNFFQSRLITTFYGCIIRPQSFVGSQDTPESAAEKIYRAARRKKKILVLTFMGKLGVFVHKLAPAYYEKKMVKLFSEEL